MNDEIAMASLNLVKTYCIIKTHNLAQKRIGSAGRGAPVLPNQNLSYRSINLLLGTIIIVVYNEVN